MSFLDMKSAYELCSASLNRSHVMLIVTSFDPYPMLIRKVVIFNSVENSWLEYDMEDSFYHCRASVAIDKSGKK